MSSRPDLILAPNQEGVLFAHQSAPNPFSYNVPVLFRLPAPIDRDRLQDRIDGLTAYDSSLFRTLKRDGASYTFGTAVRPVVETVEATSEPNDPTAVALVQELCRRPFDLFSGPLLRVHLIRYTGGASDLLVLAHHLVSDEHTVHLVAHALITGESGGIESFDHNAWAAGWWSRTQHQREVVEQVRGDLAKATGNIPMDWGCAGFAQGHSAERISIALPATVWANVINAFRSRIRTSGHSLIMAAVALILSRRTRSHNPILATAVSQRDPSSANVLGYLTNTVLVPIYTDGKNISAADYVAGVHTSCTKAYRHSQIPLIDLIEGSDLSDQIAVCVVPRTKRRVHRYQAANGALAEARERPLPDFGMDQFPLNVYWTEDFNGDVEIDIYYRRSVIADSIAQKFGEELGFTLRTLAERIDDRLSAIDTIEPDEIDRLIELGSGPGLEASNDTIVSRIERRVAEFPDNTAVRGHDGALTYCELWRDAGRVAAVLKRHGVRRNDIVAVLLERNAALVTVLIGILRLGATYLPLDTHTPPQRRTFMIKDAQATLAVTDQPRDGWADELLVIHLDEIRSSGSAPVATEPLSADSTAYIIFTSGSTGTPKGVPVAHRNVISLLDATASLISVSQSDTWTLFHSVAFDFSVWEIFGCLCSGGTLVVVPHFVARSPEDFHSLLAQEQVTVLNQTPSAFSQLLAVDREGDTLLQVRQLIFGGEALDTEILSAWFQRYPPDRCSVVNMYGITETTVHCTYRRILPDDDAARARSVGRPLPGWSIYVLDEAKRVLPLGAEGELVVGGAGVAGRYLNRPDLTRERFIDHPFPSHGHGPVYRSGDRGRYLPNGELEHLGRLDSQVKLRGFRIELDEVRVCLLRHPGVTAAAVLFDSAGGDQAKACLRGYVVSDDSFEPDAARMALRTHLPDYMVPSSLRRVERLPLTRNGKVDTAALLALTPDDKPFRPITERRAEGADALTAVVGAWQEVLGVPPEETDNFFDLGGNSMLAARLKAALERESFTGIRLRQLLAHPTPRAMADLLQSQRMEG